MWVCPKNSISLLAIALGLLIASGCSGHSVRYEANSEGEEVTSSDGGHEVGKGKTDKAAMVSRSNGLNEGGEIDGGFVNGANPYLRPGNGDSKETSRGSNFTAQNDNGMAEMDGTSTSGGTNYGQNYSGVDGSGPNHGPVSGFGNGLASNSNPDPESWANAYLGKGHGSREFYGDPSKGGTSYNGLPDESMNQKGMNPATWAENYTRENGGPSPEYVKPDMRIAHANSHPESDSVGMGRTERKGSIVESYLGDSMGTFQEGHVEDIYFAFDSWSISPDAARFLEEGAQWLQDNPGKALTIEGHCDQRGTQDYNLVLGQKRAEMAKEYLINLGVQPSRIKIVSYGKERPFCQADSEDCFQENRRNHMVVRVN